MKPRLMLPGPTPIPEKILNTLSYPLINHRGEEFAYILKEVIEGLRWVFQTKNDIMILPCSGTGGMEAVVVNALSPGDKVLCIINGVFGERFATIANCFGINVERLDFKTAQPFDLKIIEQRLEQDNNKEIKAVLMVHSETSTSMLNPLKEVSDLVKNHGCLMLVDGISSVGTVDIKNDEWGIDFLITASQKGFLVPPGLTFVSVSEKGWQAVKSSKSPRFYWDFRKHKEFMIKGQPFTTTPISLFFALKESLSFMKNQGLENIFKNYDFLTRITREAIRAIGLSLLIPDDKMASRSVTAILVPDGITPDMIKKKIKQDFNIELAGGQKDLKDKIFRIGHLGYQDPMDILSTISALEITLLRLGFNLKGSGVKTIQELLKDVQ